MNNNDMVSELASLIFRVLSAERRVTFENGLPGLFVYTTALDNGFSISARFNGVTGEYLASYFTTHCNAERDSTEFLAESVFRKLADRHARQNLPAEVYERLYA